MRARGNIRMQERGDLTKKTEEQVSLERNVNITSHKLAANTALRNTEDLSHLRWEGPRCLIHALGKDFFSSLHAF